MTALRMTAPPPDPLPARGRRPVAARLLVLGIFVALLGASGCGNTVGNAESAREPLDPLPKLPAPDADRIEYNAETRVLTLYDLPGTARWLVAAPGDLYPVAAGPEHRVRDGVDPDHTLVYYSRPGGKKSYPISLRQIQDGRGPHASHLRQ